MLPSFFRPSSSGCPSSSAVAVLPALATRSARIAGYQSPKISSADGPAAAMSTRLTQRYSNIVARGNSTLQNTTECANARRRHIPKRPHRATRSRCSRSGSSSTPASPSSRPRCSTTPTPSTPRSPARCCSATTGSPSTPTASATSKRRRSSTGRWPRRMRVSQILGHSSPQCLAVAARIPLALTVLALAFAVETFARRAFASARAGLYAALILLSVPGIFLFTRILLPDAMLCLWLTLAMLSFWLTEQTATDRSRMAQQSATVNSVILSEARSAQSTDLPLSCYVFAACCALGVLTKGLIGIVFPIAIVAHLPPAHARPRGTLTPHPRTPPILQHSPSSSRSPPPGTSSSPSPTPRTAIPAASPSPTATGKSRCPPTATSTAGPGSTSSTSSSSATSTSASPATTTPSPSGSSGASASSGSCPGQRSSSNAVAAVPPIRIRAWRQRLRPSRSRRTRRALLLLLWAALPLLFFSFSTRQEYYVLPALPASSCSPYGCDHLHPPGLATIPRRTCESHAVLPERETRPRSCAAHDTPRSAAPPSSSPSAPSSPQPPSIFLLHTHTPAPNTDLAALLQQNPGDYALSMGHFLDLNAQALGLFRLPLALAAASLFLGPLASLSSLPPSRRRSPRRHISPSPPEPSAFSSPPTSACRPSPRSSARSNSPPPSPRRSSRTTSSSSTRSTSTPPPSASISSAQLPLRRRPPQPAADHRARRQRPRRRRDPRHRRQPDPHPHRPHLQRHPQLRPQLQPLVRQLLPRCPPHLRDRRNPSPRNGAARSASSSGRTSPTSPARCPRRSRPSTSSPNPAAKRSSATSRTGNA